MLTTAAASRARPGPRAWRLRDEAGLYLDIRPTGAKIWRWRWRDAAGREQLLTIGGFPELSPEAARARRDQARAAVAAGADPRPDQNPVKNFEAAARAWHAHRAPGWSAVHAGDVLRSLERDVFPVVGDRQLNAIAPPDVLQLLEAIEARGAIATARRVRQRVEELFAFATAKGWATCPNPAAVGAALANAPAEGRQPALVDLAELRGLMAAVDALAAAPAILAAHRFAALTAVRLAALRGMTWAEVEDLDGAAPLWRVPAARMKLAAKHKADPARDHLVPLSPAAAAVLREALPNAPANEGLVFRGRDGLDPIGAGALNDLYARAGFAGRHCAHGWRAAFSTVMNHAQPELRWAIERALGHAVKDMTKAERAYNRAQHLDQRRDLFEEWATLLLDR